MAQRRPNILIVTTDQQRWDSLSLYGQPGYRTPNLDRLARQGVCFDRAYTPCPICTPARISMITGQYPTRHGAYTIGMAPTPALEGPTLASELASAGYATAIIGKTHFVARQMEDRHVAGFDVNAPDEPDEAFWAGFDGLYVGFEHVRHCGSHNIDHPPSAHYRRWLNEKGVNVDHLHRKPGDEAHNARLPREGRWELDPEFSQNAWIVDEATQWIGRQAPGKPWLCMANFQDPHTPFVCSEPWYSEVDMEGVDLGEPRPDLSDKPPFYQRFVDGKYWTEVKDGKEVHYWDGICLAGAWQYKNVRDPATAIRAYIGMVNQLDHYIGRLLDDLEARGLSDETLVVFTTDHGEMLGRHGFWWKGLPSYEDNQRIPLLMRYPGIQKGAMGRRAAFANLVDLMPTALDAAGVEIPQGVQGVSQLPVLRGEVDSVQDFALVDNLCTVPRAEQPGTVGMHQLTLVHGDYKLVVYRHATDGELYNLKEDPEQNVNLFERSEAQGIRQQMMHKLVQAQMASTGRMAQRIGPA